MEIPFEFMDLVMSKRTFPVQLTLLAFHALFWYTVIPVAAGVLRRHIDKQPYKKRFIEIAGKSWESTFQSVFPSVEKTYDFSLLFAGIVGQHAVGGLLIMPALFPSMFPFISKELGLALARHGAMCEAGWELEDALDRFYQTKIKGDFSMNPANLIKFVVVHHAMGLSLIVPMNVLYGDFYLYHKGVFLMQGVAALALSCQYYGFTLDITRRSELIQMRVLATVNFAAMFYCRAIAFGGLCYELLPIFYNENRALLVASCITAGLMQVLNISFISDAWKKMIKYNTMPLPMESKRPVTPPGSPKRAMQKAKKAFADIILPSNDVVLSQAPVQSSKMD